MAWVILSIHINGILFNDNILLIKSFQTQFVFRPDTSKSQRPSPTRIISTIIISSYGRIWSAHARKKSVASTILPNQQSPWVTCVAIFQVGHSWADRWSSCASSYFPIVSEWLAFLFRIQKSYLKTQKRIRCTINHSYF